MSAEGSPGVRKMSPGLYKRLFSGPGQFALAVGACFLLVLGIVALSPGNGVLSFGGHQEILPSADPNDGAVSLRLSAPYQTYAPEGLPATWRATSSRVTGASAGRKTPVSWHLGYVTPASQYAALEESNERAGAFISRMTNVNPAAPGALKGTHALGGALWQEYYRADKKQRSLVRHLPDATLVVTGTASYDELAVLAASLQAQPKP